jgi:hypothetical protein
VLALERRKFLLHSFPPWVVFRDVKGYKLAAWRHPAAWQLQSNLQEVRPLLVALDEEVDVMEAFHSAFVARNFLCEWQNGKDSTPVLPS